MANKLDKIIIVDLESTCWHKDSPERLQESEIIEIGICEVGVASVSIIGKESILVKPCKSTISEFCTELTTLTPELVEREGIEFDDACALLRSKYKTQHRTWASWGDYDRRQFERQCSRDHHSASYPFGVSHLNVKNLFALSRA